MKPKNRLPLRLETKEEARRLFVEFKEWMQTKESGHVDGNIHTRLTGAGFFIDFLSGRKPRRLKPNESYRHYPDKPWPTD